MTILGFSGSRQPLTVRLEDRITQHLEHFGESASGFVTGACIGVDAFVGTGCLVRWPERQHIVVVPADLSRVDQWWRAGGFSPEAKRNLTVVWMPKGTTYRNRNTEIVLLSTQLIAYPAGIEHDSAQKRSGTWQTVRIARRLHSLAPLEFPLNTL